jgi:hypothetical protein
MLTILSQTTIFLDLMQRAKYLIIEVAVICDGYRILARSNRSFPPRAKANASGAKNASDAPNC